MSLFSFSRLLGASARRPPSVAALHPALPAFAAFRFCTQTGLKPRLSAKMETSLVRQANRELYNSNTYLSMSFYFERGNLPGFVKFLRHESEAERTHALKIFEYVQKRGGVSQVLATEEAVSNSWATPVEIFGNIVALERGNADRVSDLLDLALAEKDHATHAFLQDFIKESVDEEDEAMSLYSMVQDYSSIKGLIHHMDKIIGKKAK